MAMCVDIDLCPASPHRLWMLVRIDRKCTKAAWGSAWMPAHDGGGARRPAAGVLSEWGCLLPST